MRYLSIILFLYLSLSAENTYYIMTGGNDKLLKYWQVPSGNKVKELRGHTDGITALAISFNGDYLLSADLDFNLKYWRLYDGYCLWTIKEDEIIKSISFTTDDKYAIIGIRTRKIHRYRLLDGVCLNKIRTGFPLYGSDGNYDGSKAICYGDTNCIDYWSIPDSVVIRSFNGHTGDVIQAIFSQNDEYMLSGSYDKTVKFWRISDGTCIRTLTNQSPVGSIDIYLAPDGYYALSCADITRYWRMSDGVCLKSYSELVYKGELRFSPDGKNAAVLSPNPNFPNAYNLYLNYYRLSDGNVFCSVKGDNYALYAFAFNPVQETGYSTNQSSSSLPAHSFSISPNPFSTRLSVSLPSSGAIYSLTGKLIMKLPKGKHSIDASKWREGVYVVKSGMECKRVVKIR
ncbi:MAG: hypothetical protein JXA60_10990 [Candidatus Coatesbacteria bacterium]|nr:hypothetical protein [Candidatus Coatesbacteria bacterium]